MKQAKINEKATILKGLCKGMIGTVVSADVVEDKVYVGVRVDEYTVIETTTDNIEQDYPIFRRYDTETAIKYMTANPYKNVMKRVSDGLNYAYDQDGFPRVNKGMWLSISEEFKENEEWELPNPNGN